MTDSAASGAAKARTTTPQTAPGDGVYQTDDPGRGPAPAPGRAPGDRSWSPGPTTDVDTDAVAELDIDVSDPRTAFLLAVADDELVTGHRTSHWTGVAPSLEEDIAFSGISQDEINHADVFYQYVVTTATRSDGGEGDSDRSAITDRDAVDRLALGRRPDQYRHAILCERPPGDFAFTLARHWLYDHADAVRLDALADSSEAELAAIARKLAHEERYHLEHADTWFWRLARADGEPRDRLRGGLEATFGEALWLFEPTTGEDEIVDTGLLSAASGELLDRWLDIVGTMLDEAGLAEVMEPITPSGDTSGGQADTRAWDRPADLFDEAGGRHGTHTDDFAADMWPEMTALYRAHPGATW